MRCFDCHMPLNGSPKDSEVAFCFDCCRKIAASTVDDSPYQGPMGIFEDYEADPEDLPDEAYELNDFRDFGGVGCERGL